MNIQNQLLEWFGVHRRPLPWRRRYRPYEVWVSEIMLQQTQVRTMLPFFSRWMKEFPSISSLAKSDSKKVLKAWQGLGYYSRARNLHESAKKILRDYGGDFPENFEDIRGLKGIGRYTAGAIASIAYNQNRPIVDGNILRVLSRVFAIKKPIDVEKNKEHFWKLEEKLIPQGRARDFNQALMELGALICLPKNPRCPECPLEKFCLARKQNAVENYPVKLRVRKKVKVQAAALVLSKKGRFLIHRRPVGKIMGGLWEFPEWKLAFGRVVSGQTAEKKIAEKAYHELGTFFSKPRPFGKLKRSYTHHQETLWLFRSECYQAPSHRRARSGWPQTWASLADFERYPFSSAHAKIAQRIKEFV